MFTRSLALALMLSLVVTNGVVVANESARMERFRELYRLDATSADQQVYWDGSMDIRIGVMEAQETVTFTAPAEFRISDGTTTVVGAAGDEFIVRVKSSTPAQRLFHPVVQTVLKTKETTLLDVVDKWKGLGHTVDVFPAGAKLYYRDFLIHDSRRYFVAVEPRETQEDCEACFQELMAQGARPWPFETLVKEATGVIELVDGDGTVVTECDGPLTITCDEPVKVFRVEYGVGYSWHGFEDRSFRGTLEVRVDKVGKLVLVNELNIELYLRGVVPSEMSAHYPHHALCSQAIAARGETLSKYGTRHLADPYHLCASQHCQVYSGLAKEHVNTSKAVDETKGRILRHGSSIADTVYAACCGGHTEHNDYVWSTDPCGALRGKPCLAPDSTPFPSPMTEAALKVWFTERPKAWCNLPVAYYQKRFRWKKRFSVAEATEFVAKKFPEVGTVQQIVPLSRGVSGRLRELKIVGSQSTVVVQKELPIRFLFGGLNSGAFVVDQTSTGWDFTGGGWGHGVGLCQWGARGMAEAGHTYRQILSHYFSDTYILNVYRLRRRDR